MTAYIFRTPQAKFAFLWRFNDPLETEQYYLFFLIGIPFLSLSLIKFKQ